jgi:hypothetical protein
MLSVRSAGPTIHHEAIDWATRASSNGGVISTTTIRAVSDFCRSINANGLRSSMYRLNLFCGGNLSAALVPLYRSTSFGGTVIGNSTDTNVNFVSGDHAETGSSAGLTGNGTNKYLNTGFPANTIAAGSMHLGAGIAAADTSTATFRTLIGAYSGVANSVGLTSRTNNATEYAACLTRFGTVSDTFGDNIGTTGGFLAVGNIVASWPTMYRNGVASGATATTSQNYPAAHSLFVFAVNVYGSSASNYSAARLNWYSFGASMTSGQVSSFNAALTAFSSALSRS